MPTTFKRYNFITANRSGCITGS